ncbi:DoxX family protein [Halorubraceae archaeon YAN]|nr:DoxX family protein [Halorubraceae archaeon YAN]
MILELPLIVESTLPFQSLFDTALSAELFLAARVLFGGVLAFMGLNHFMNAEAMAGYAEMKGVPAPKLSVLFTGGMLLFGGVGIALGVAPTIASGALIAFLLVTTPLMHDFWAAPEEQKQSEMTAFLKNTVMLAATIGFLALSGIEWPYAIGIGIF